MMHLLTCSSSKTEWVVSSVSLGNRKTCTNIVTFLPQLSPPGSRVSPGTDVLDADCPTTQSAQHTIPVRERAHYLPTYAPLCLLVSAGNCGRRYMNNTQWDSKQQ